MNLFVFGAAYITAFAQEKYVYIKEFNKDINIRIFTPKFIKGSFGYIERQRNKKLAKEEIVEIKSYFNSSHMKYLLDPFKIIFLLIKYRPERIHIEEDPYSIIAFEVILLKLLFSKKTKISFFLWDNLDRTPTFPKNIWKRFSNRYFLSLADFVVVGNIDGEKILRFNKKYNGKIYVLPQLGLNEKKYIYGDKTKRETINIGYAGRLVEEKGLRDLYNAFLKLNCPNKKLIILGSGPLLKEITEWMKILGDMMEYHPAIPHNEMPNFFKFIDIFVLPSVSTKRWKEQFGLVLAEAMMSGVPCVGSSSGAIPEVIGPGGLIYTEQDVKSLTLCLQTLVDNNDLRLSYGKRGQQFAKERYSLKSLSKKYIDIFNERA
ncbi:MULTISPECIES: glycosyltransferase family 4 protein [unclassified Polynucleobacter]|uniref:glycosyltransferase family 4 protein n=1 Tax=unclassified Polynucleobacter TaxID=2640945 RepID=UPI002574393D|nr:MULTISPECIES: glycosyltransferase family 4 protein [unclassified Polynucleobacter]BEI42149.1 glycosyltransferase family 4 protein [Polynucleobacter sp. HIN10]BEI43927.1 glycosyltransferase family 4 protein [Polynucleobacter sp. HIN11]